MALAVKAGPLVGADPRKIDLADHLQNTPPALELQIRRLSRRFVLSVPAAVVIAGLAYGEASHD